MKSAAIAKLSGAKIRYGFDTASMREPASRIFLNRSVEVPKNTNIIRKNLALAAVALGFEIPENGLKFPISTELAHTRERDDIVSGANAKFAILNPAGGWVTKLWPAENYGALA
jgi:ADP-heptose:LPS heptosyltransferase